MTTIEILRGESMGNFLVSRIEPETEPEDEGGWMSSGFATKEQIKQWRSGLRWVSIVGEQEVLDELGLLRMM